MTVATATEMRVRGRRPSPAPAHVIGRLLGIEIRSARARDAISWTAHVPFGVALGAGREALARAGLGEPAATVAFLALAWLPDLALVPALGGADPPWRWPRVELALSAGFHAAYVLAASAAWRRAAER
jgi:hypothetical protein